MCVLTGLGAVFEEGLTRASIKGAHPHIHSFHAFHAVPTAASTTSLICLTVVPRYCHFHNAYLHQLETSPKGLPEPLISHLANPPQGQSVARSAASTPAFHIQS